MNKWLNMFTWGGREVGGMDSGVQGVWCDMLWGGWRGKARCWLTSRQSFQIKPSPMVDHTELGVGVSWGVRFLGLVGNGGKGLTCLQWVMGQRSIEAKHD